MRNFNAQQSAKAVRQCKRPHT